MENPYLSPPRVKAALRTLDIRPTRGMGQNFLVDPVALGAIVAAAELNVEDTALEVGPGLGVLTWELLQRAGRVVAVELDRRLAARLRDEFAHEPRLSLIQGDILRLSPDELIGADHRRPTTDDRPPIADHEDTKTRRHEDREVENQAPSDVTLSPCHLVTLSEGSSYKVVANLPYAITSAALRHFLEASRRPELLVVLVQWEVAQRIAARPGELSVLAHSVQVYAEPEVLMRVPAASFFPAPEVDSAVLRLRVRPQPAVDVDSIDGLLRVVKAGFLHGRKKLANGLPSGLAAMGARVEKEQVGTALQAAGVDPNRRAETLTLEEWAGVYRALREG